MGRSLSPQKSASVFVVQDVHVTTSIKSPDHADLLGA